MNIKTIENLSDLTDKTAIVRVDFNVPIKNGVISDDTRIKSTLPTLKALLDKNARIIIISHLGRPKGSINLNYSLKPISEHLSQLLEQEVSFVDDCLKIPPSKKIILMENLRFYNEEENNNIDFAKKLSKYADIYVNDAFSTAHRAHASTHALAKLLPAYAGCLMAKEIEALNSALENPARPVAAIVGGAKISTKLIVLNNLIKKVDVLILGGGMANTFLAAKGINIGKSLQEIDMHDIANKIMLNAEQQNCKIILPIDAQVTAKFEQGYPIEEVDINNIPKDKMMLDIGTNSIALIIEEIKSCKTILWNGPLGVFEMQPFDIGTNSIAKYVAERTKIGRLTSIAGGGDTVSALANANVKQDFSYISTAGGAFLEWIEGKTLPAITMLDYK